MLYILKLLVVCLLQKYGKNGTAVHSKTSMLLVEITCIMLYIGNRNLKVSESFS